MLSLIFIRHGETDWNHQHRIQGQLDIPLNGCGKTQAAKLIPIVQALFKDPVPPSKVYASPLKRAYETARIALNGCAEIIPDDELMEIDYGRWANRIGSELEVEYPGEVQRWFRQFEPGYCPHGGESREALRSRAARFHQRVITPHISTTNQRILIFSHGGLIAAYLNQLFGTVIRFSMDNTCLTEVLFRPDEMIHLHQFNAHPDQAFCHYLLKAK